MPYTTVTALRLGGNVINDSGLYHRVWVESALINPNPINE
jgi:hypothetical protein